MSSFLNDTLPSKSLSKFHLFKSHKIVSPFKPQSCNFLGWKKNIGTKACCLLSWRPFWTYYSPTQKLTWPLKMDSWKMNFLLGGPFSVDMLVSGRVPTQKSSPHWHSCGLLQKDEPTTVPPGRKIHRNDNLHKKTWKHVEPCFHSVSGPFIKQTSWL